MIYLSHNNSIKTLLNIKDKNIEFDNQFITHQIIKGVMSKVFHAKLSYTPDFCDCCGAHDQIIKYGYINCLINYPKFLNYNTYLNLKKQRFYCKSCEKTFMAKTDLVDKKCSISKLLKLAIALESREKISEKDIARRFNVSHVTVSRIISSHYSDYSADRNYLPKVLCFDEFKSVKRCSGAMSFIMCDGETHEIVDIVEDRRLNKLIDYFSRYSYEARMNVKNIVIDMYAPYISLIKKIFPNAKISIDRFHLVQLVNRSLNKTRISIMNKYASKNRKLYNKYKRYWKLLLMHSTNLSYENKYQPTFRRYISQNEIVDYLLKQDADLEAAYDVYQDLIFAIKNKDFEYFKESVENYKNGDYSIMEPVKWTL